jgi:ATP-dependent helicase HrpB
MADFELPEVRRIDLCSTVLGLHGFGHTDPRAFDWYERPDEQMLAAAEDLLHLLGALKNGKLTNTGQQLMSLPVHPRLGRVLLAAAESNHVESGAAIAALLSEKDILRTDTTIAFRDRGPAVQSDSDLLVRLDLLEHKGSTLHDQLIDRNALRQVVRVKEELTRFANRLPISNRKSQISNPLLLPLLAYPDRVCRRRASDPSAAAMVGGAGVRLAPESAVRKPELFLALDARRDERSARSEALVRIASGIELLWLEQFFADFITRTRDVIFDAQRQRVVGRIILRYRDLILREDPDAAVDPEQAGPVLAAALQPRASELIASDEKTANLLARLALLRQHMPEHNWPTLDANELISQAAIGKRSVDEVKSALPYIIQSHLPYPLDRLLEHEAPDSIEVPSGSHIRITYSSNQPPTLAVRLQELFGWTATPRIAGGRIPVRLQLLGPNFRPVQITDDLASFWATTYFQVRKDLKARYPKHSWPENPLTAKPQAKGSRK